MLKKPMNKKVASAVSVIGGADGPTSVFLAGGKGSKGTLKQRIQRRLYTLRKNRIAKALKANPHTMDEVIEYARSKWGYTDISRESNEYQTEYIQMRASFLLMYQPELLGDLKERPKLEAHDEESIKHFMTLMDQRQKAAEEIPAELFDIDLCILEINEEELNSTLSFEKNYEYIGGSASGKSKRAMKRYHRAFRDIYQYYGVSQSDIDNRTKRYEDVVKTLAAR